MSNFTNRLEIDGLHNIQYNIIDKIEEKYFSRIVVDYHRDMDDFKKLEGGYKKLVNSHSCLKSIKKLEKC